MTATTATPLASDAPWVVLKFGGTSVATAERWRTIQKLAATRRAEGMRVLVVVSALSGITDALKALCTCAPAEREAALAGVVARHRELATQMRLADVARVEHWLASLQALFFPFPPGEGGAAAPGERAAKDGRTGATMLGFTGKSADSAQPAGATHGWPRARNTRSRNSSSSWVCVYGVSRS